MWICDSLHNPWEKGLIIMIIVIIIWTGLVLVLLFCYKGICWPVQQYLLARRLVERFSLVGTKELSKKVNVVLAAYLVYFYALVVYCYNFLQTAMFRLLRLHL